MILAYLRLSERLQTAIRAFRRMFVLPKSGGDQWGATKSNPAWTMQDTKCLCRVMWPEVHGVSVRRKCMCPVLSASRNLRLFSILQSVGAPKTTTALPSASVAQLLNASAANSSTSESSEQDRICTSLLAAWQVTSARRPKVHADSEQRQNVANLSRFKVLPVVE